MTRAKQKLYLTGASSRTLWGVPRMMQPSRFLREIPSRHLHSYNMTVPIEEPEQSSF